MQPEGEETHLGSATVLESSVVLTSEGCRVFDVFNRKEQIPKDGRGANLLFGIL